MWPQFLQTLSFTLYSQIDFNFVLIHMVVESLFVDFTFHLNNFVDFKKSSYVFKVQKYNFNSRYLKIYLIFISLVTVL